MASRLPMNNKTADTHHRDAIKTQVLLQKHWLIESPSPTVDRTRYPPRDASYARSGLRQNCYRGDLASRITALSESEAAITSSVDLSNG